MVETVPEAKIFVDVTPVNTPVEGVVAPIVELSMVPPEMVRLFATFASARLPVMEPKEPRASVTPAFPSVPELMAVALMEPVASMVSPFATFASVIELLGRESCPVTPRFVVVTLVPVAFVHEKSVVESFVAAAVVAKKYVDVVFVKMLLVAKRLVDVVFVPVAFVQLMPGTVRGLATRRFVKLPVVAKRLVVVVFVEVVFVNVAAEAMTVPMTEPLMVELVMIASLATRFLMVPASALMVEPEAVANPNQEVEVPFVNIRFEVILLVAKRFVDVVFVPVAFVQLMPGTVRGFVMVRLSIFPLTV